MSSPFSVGQRWVSNTESELGLGLVESNDRRQITVYFPAVDEQRIYAADNAPLSRVEYSIGEQVRTAEDVLLTIETRALSGHCLVYTGHTADGARISVPEAELASAVQFSKPQDRLLAGQIDANSSFELRADALKFRQRHRGFNGFGLLGPRIQLLPHQLHIAARVSARPAPRVLLADEVGLGKTIEAGLIVHQQLLTGRLQRVLVMVPEPLVHQWLVELLRRFNLRFSVFDETRCEACDESGEPNPFDTAQLVIAALPWLESNPQRAEQCLASGWDMLIVDEAHHLAWTEFEASGEYRLVERFARDTPGLLLLTATPEQLGVEGHFARLRLVDPDRYHDLAAFRQEEASYVPLATLVEQLQNTSPDETAVSAALAELGDNALTHEVNALLQDSPDKTRRTTLVDRLLDRHGTGRVLFRNTRQAVGGFPERQLVRYPLQDTGDGTNRSELNARLAWLTGWLREHRGTKVLLIVGPSASAQLIERHLRLSEGFRTAVFHEDMTLLARDRAAAYFADLEEGADILVCSEIGGEGRNFQFAHHLVLFDLPEHPDLLEQRIGRLDRIGQRSTVNIHVPFASGTSEHVWLRWYDEGIDAFRQPCTGGERVLQQIEAEFAAALASPSDESCVDTLITQTQHVLAEVAQSLDHGRDRLLELNSCHPERAAHIVSTVAESAQNLELDHFMERVFDRFGVDREPHTADSIVLRPTDQMLVESFPALPEDGLTATYSRTRALAREDMQFLTWEHPMVLGVMDLIASGELGNTALCTAKVPGIRPGKLLLETLFILQTVAPASLGLERYMQQPLLRVLLDDEGRDLGGHVSMQDLNQRTERVPRRTAEDVVRHARSAITELVAQAETVAGGQLDGLISQALDEATRRRGAEQQRLEALAEVNPNIEPREIEHHLNVTTRIRSCLEAATFKLDALRVIVTV